MLTFSGDSSRDLRNDDDEINDPVEERLTLAERNERLQNQLKSLKDELSGMKYFVIDTNRIHKKIILVPFVKEKKKSSNFQFHEKKSHYFQLLEMILVKLLWIVFTKKMLSKGEINTRPCVKFVKAIPNDVWINSKICKRLFYVCKSF